MLSVPASVMGTPAAGLWGLWVLASMSASLTPSGAAPSLPSGRGYLLPRRHSGGATRALHRALILHPPSERWCCCLVQHQIWAARCVSTRVAKQETGQRCQLYGASSTRRLISVAAC